VAREPSRELLAVDVDLDQKIIFFDIIFFEIFRNVKNIDFDQNRDLSILMKIDIFRF
jgi:hypothetical protein